MKYYTVYFEIYGKKMKTTVLAKSQDDAKQQVVNKISFIKIEPAKSTFNSIMDQFDDVLNMFPKK